jgi:anti-sigma factor RsiW
LRDDHPLVACRFHADQDARLEPKRLDQAHEQLRELLGAYALGAAEPRERAALAAHLPTCPACQAELAELRGAVAALPLTVEEREPPPALRARIEAAARQDLAAAPRREAQPLASPPVTISPAAAPAARRWLQSGWLAAAALLVVAAGLLFWNLRLQQEVGPARGVAVALQTSSPAAGAGGAVTYLPDRGVVLLDVHGLPALAPGQVYQVWLIDAAGQPVPAGTFAQSNATHAVAANPRADRAVAITAEPGPLGSPRPTGAILAQAPIPSA